MSPSNFTQDHLTKLEWLVTDVTAVGSPDRVGLAILEMIFAKYVFWPIQAIFAVGEPLCEAGTPS